MEPWRAAPPTYARAEHVWVDTTNTWGDKAEAGILVDWRKGRSGWEGLVIRASTFSTGSGSAFMVMQSWVPKDMIRHAEAKPAPPRDLSGFRPVNADRPRD